MTYHAILQGVRIGLLALGALLLFAVIALRQSAPMVDEMFRDSSPHTSPHAIWKDATTRSPCFSPLTAGPIDSTTPQNSWPRISPFSSSTTVPCSKCKSLPQTVLPVTFRMTSLSSTTRGFGTSSALRETSAASQTRI